MGRSRGLPHDEIASLYRSGVSIKDIAERYDCAPRSIRYVAEKYKLGGRKGIQPPVKGPFNTAHPVMSELFAHAAKERATMRAIAKCSGVGRNTLRRWAMHRFSPDFFSLVAAGEVLGLELTWRKKGS